MSSTNQDNNFLAIRPKNESYFSRQRYNVQNSIFRY